VEYIAVDCWGEMILKSRKAVIFASDGNLFKQNLVTENPPCFEASATS
jgi:hypothetical protein